MNHYRQVKRAISLLEILIVIFLIGIISTVVAVNLSGSLNKGKAFKSKQMKQQLEEVFTLALMQDSDITPEDIKANPEKFLRDSPLIKDPKNALLDGWNKPFEISITKDDEIKVSSSNLDSYEKKQKKNKGK